MKKILVALVASLAIGVTGCATSNGIPSPTLNATAQAQLQSALDSYCPVLTAVQLDLSATPSLNTTTVQKAVSTLSLACPPNPPPTNGIVVAADVLAAYTILAPLLAKK